MQAHSLPRAANRSFIDSYRVLCRHVAGAAVEDLPGVFTFSTGAFSTGLPFGLFNGCIVTTGAEPAHLESGYAEFRLSEWPAQSGP